jgi:UDP-glucose 4-epimerase
MWIFLTGSTGFIGSHLLARLAEKHQVICISRRKVEESRGAAWIQGNFDCLEDLKKLDTCRLDLVVHLAAILNTGAEEPALETNFMGTGRLIRYFVDRGCRRFILASSIAVTGCLDERFLPVQLPIPDEHPCMAYEPYGFSKALMEELAAYYNRQYPDTEFVNLRYGVVRKMDEWYARGENATVNMAKPFVDLAFLDVEDAVSAVLHAVEKGNRPGVHTYNVVGPDVTCTLPTAEMLRAVMGDRVKGLDMSFYEQEGKKSYPIYSIEKVKEELGFVPVKPTRPLTEI